MNRYRNRLTCVWFKTVFPVLLDTSIEIEILFRFSVEHKLGVNTKHLDTETNGTVSVSEMNLLNNTVYILHTGHIFTLTKNTSLLVLVWNFIWFLSAWGRVWGGETLSWSLMSFSRIYKVSVSHCLCCKRSISGSQVGTSLKHFVVCVIIQKRESSLSIRML